MRGALLKLVGFQRLPTAFKDAAECAAFAGRNPAIGHSLKDALLRFGHARYIVSARQVGQVDGPVLRRRTHALQHQATGLQVALQGFINDALRHSLGVLPHQGDDGALDFVARTFGLACWIPAHPLRESMGRGRSFSLTHFESSLNRSENSLLSG